MKSIVKVFCFSFLFVSTSLFAQIDFEDVLYLKDGSIIRGTIIEQIPTEYLKIELLGGSVLVYKMEDIEKIQREEIHFSVKDFQKGKIVNRGAGYKNISEFGFLVGGAENSGYRSAAFTMQTINGYQFNHWLFTGIGAGLDRYGEIDHTYSPIFVSLSGEPFEKRTSPYYFLDVGYSFAWRRNENNTGIEFDKAIGGPMTHVGFGLKVNTRSNVGYIISVGYKFHKSTYKFTEYNWWTGEPIRISENRTFNRISVKTGLTF